MPLASPVAVLLSCVLCAFTLKGSRVSTVACYVTLWLWSPALHGPLPCPAANKHTRFHFPAVSKGRLNSGYCLMPLCSLSNSSSPFPLLYTNHLSFSLIAFPLIYLPPFCWLIMLSNITICNKKKKKAEFLTWSYCIILALQCCKVFSAFLISSAYVLESYINAFWNDDFIYCSKKKAIQPGPVWKKMVPPQSGLSINWVHFIDKMVWFHSLQTCSI